MRTLLLLLGLGLGLCIPCTANAGGGAILVSPSSPDSAWFQVHAGGIPIPGACYEFTAMTELDNRFWAHVDVAWPDDTLEITSVAWSGPGCEGFYSGPSNVLVTPAPPLLLRFQ